MFPCAPSSNPYQDGLRVTEALNTTGWHYEYGSATAFFVLPQEGRSALMSAARGNAGAAVAVASQGNSWSDPELAAMGGSCSESVPADENGVRDVRKVIVSWRVSPCVSACDVCV